MKLNSCTWAAALGLFLASPVFANQTTFSVFNDYSRPILPGINLGAAGILSQTSLSDTFDLTTDGFVPGTDTAVSGTAFFDIFDAVNLLNRERIAIDLGSISELPSSPVHSYSFSFDTLGGASDVSILADINADGKLDYTITAVKGDFFVVDSGLSVLANTPDGHVDPAPDGGSTIALLGLGLAGLGGLARKFNPARPGH